MKCGNSTLRKVENVGNGDTVEVTLGGENYVVESVEKTSTGRILHKHAAGNSSYWPGQLVWVVVPPEWR
jgi:hypothetical protein